MTAVGRKGFDYSWVKEPLLGLELVEASNSWYLLTVELFSMPTIRRQEVKVLGNFFHDIVCTFEMVTYVATWSEQFKLDTFLYNNSLGLVVGVTPTVAPSPLITTAANLRGSQLDTSSLPLRLCQRI